MRWCLMGIVIGCLGMAGCGHDIQGMCEAQIACEGGNDLDVDACVATNEIDADYYDDIGCADEYDAYYACAEPISKCNEFQIAPTCSTDGDCFGGQCSNGACVSKVYGIDAAKVDMCEAEQNALTRCR